MASYRGQKINNEIKRELADVLRDVKDPRVPKLISVVKAEVTKDLKYGKIYVSMIGTDEEKKQALKGLKSSAGFLRSEIGKRLNIRSVPELSFVMDDSIEYGAHIMEILNEINKE